jgi:predicted DNA-binding ribbon-helix-helix protein
VNAVTTVVAIGGTGIRFCIRANMRRRTITIGRRRTSVLLEPVFWDYLDELAAANGITWKDVVRLVAADRPPGVSVASALRTFCLRHLLGHLAARGAPTCGSC